MQSKQGLLHGRGSLHTNLGGPVKAIREASPQALHHFTQADQVHQLVSASDALEARDCTHDRPTASRGVAPGSPRSDRTRAGCFRWR